MAEGKEKKEEVVKPVPQQPKKTEKEQPRQTVIYAGPNLPGGILAQYTMFRDGLPAHVEALKEKYKVLDTLIVPISELNAIQQLIAKEGTSQYKAYKELLKGGN